MSRFALLCLIFPAFAPAARADPAAPVRSVLSVGCTVRDLDRSVEFFSGVLNFEKIAGGEDAGPEIERLVGVFGARIRAATLKLGDERIELTEYLAPEGRPIPVDSRSNDLWFQHIAIVVSDIESAYRHFRKFNVRHASSGPQRLPDSNPNAGGISAFYFKDPDGHVLEIINFPPDKGDAKWHKPAAGRLFLGIDHSAIVVKDTEASLKFYRDQMGLKIAGTSENFGTEQEHLNNVFGARLRITSLRSPEGSPGIELLEYLAPGNGRAFPADTLSCDLWHWQTKLRISEARAASEALTNFRVPFISGTVATKSSSFGPDTGFMVRDPDGHALWLYQPK